MSERLSWHDVADFVVSQSTEEDLDRLVEAIKDRRRHLANVTAATLDVGDVVVLHHISPKALAGLKGSVASINGKRADVELDTESTVTLRWSRTRFAAAIGDDTDHYVVRGVPLSALKSA